MVSWFEQKKLLNNVWIVEVCDATGDAIKNKIRNKNYFITATDPLSVGINSKINCGLIPSSLRCETYKIEVQLSSAILFINAVTIAVL